MGGWVGWLVNYLVICSLFVLVFLFSSHSPVLVRGLGLGPPPPVSLAQCARGSRDIAVGPPVVLTVAGSTRPSVGS